MRLLEIPMPTGSLDKLKLNPSSASSLRMLLPRLGIPSSSSSQNVLPKRPPRTIHMFLTLLMLWSVTWVTFLYPHYSMSLILLHYSHTPRHMQLILSSYLTQRQFVQKQPWVLLLIEGLFLHDFLQLLAIASPLIRIHPLKNSFLLWTTLPPLLWLAFLGHSVLPTASCCPLNTLASLGVLRACKPSANEVEPDVFQFRDQPHVTWQDPNQSVCVQLN